MGSAAIFKLPEPRRRRLLEDKKTLFIFVGLSLISGITLEQADKGLHEKISYSYLPETIFILSIWFMLVVWSHALCKYVLSGNATFGSNIACTLYALSASYFLGHFAGASIAIFQMSRGEPNIVIVVAAFAIVRMLVFVLIATTLLCASNGFKLARASVVVCFVSLPLLLSLWVIGDAFVTAIGLHKAFPGGLPGG